MSIQRVPEVPFAQIANSALRDSRLSFKARGILALVLSNVGEWEATARWIEEQSEVDGAHAVQTALNELTALGYRQVINERGSGGQIRTVALWRHLPEEAIIRPPENPPTGLSDHRKTDPRLEHHPSEHHEQNTSSEIVRKPVDDDPLFAQFWNVYPRRADKGHARRAWQKAVRKVDPSVIIAGAASYRDDPNREPEFTAYAATWLNGERWFDESLPERKTRAGEKVGDVQSLIARAAERDGQMEIGP